MLLRGIRVLAFETGLAGPLCTRLLADLGAEVVKIERPGVGDVTRGWDTIAGGLSSGFVWVNRGKRSVELDVTDAAERDKVEALVGETDVVVQNFTPGWADRVGLDAASLRGRDERLVYTELSGYGRDGPFATKNAYDLVMQGETGLILLTGSKDEPARVGVSICDLATGSYAAVATLAALVRRAETGVGAHVSVSLFDTMVDWLGYFPHLWWHRRELPARTGMHHPLFCPYGPYEGADGLFGIAVLSPQHWRALCEEVLDRTDLAADPEYATNEGRVRHREELDRELADEFRRRPAEDWLERLDRAGVPCGHVNDVAQVMEHPQLAHNRLVVEVGSPVGPLPTIGPPFLVDGERPSGGAVPGLGEHTDVVLGGEQ